MIQTDEDKGFEEFWSLQLRKLDKGHARNAWKKALKKSPAEKIIDAYKNYAAFVRANQKELQYVPYPATWLNGERWEDQLPGQSAGVSSEAAKWRVRLKAFVERKFWPETWGAKPGNGCSCPPAILKEFGLQP